MPLRIFCEPPTLFLLMQSLTAILQLEPGDVFHERRFGCETSQSAGQLLLGNREAGGGQVCFTFRTPLVIRHVASGELKFSAGVFVRYTWANLTGPDHTT